MHLCCALRMLLLPWCMGFHGQDVCHRWAESSVLCICTGGAVSTCACCSGRMLTVVRYGPPQWDPARWLRHAGAGPPTAARGTERRCILGSGATPTAGAAGKRRGRWRWEWRRRGSRRTSPAGGLGCVRAARCLNCRLNNASCWASTVPGCIAPLLILTAGRLPGEFLSPPHRWVTWGSERWRTRPVRVANTSVCSKWIYGGEKNAGKWNSLDSVTLIFPENLSRSACQNPKIFLNFSTVMKREARFNIMKTRLEEIC